MTTRAKSLRYGGVIPAAVLAALAAVGCGVPVTGGVDEADANRIVVALDRARVDATKELDPATDGRFRIVVARDDVARALNAMSEEGLPRPNPTGVLGSVGKGVLVPSRAAEHAEVVAGMAGDLERTLESIDGVLSARVHLNVPEPDPFRDVARGKATASVLIEHRPAREGAPISVAEVQRLLAGGVARLAPEDIAVVMIERTARAAGEDAPQLAHVGPIAVARSSARALESALGGLFLLVAALAAMTLGLYARLLRERGARANGGSGGSAA